ncbi:hypothetical protein QYE76_059024 [Lolium multiflorum]|uniref:Uncharacterized protein n=1 Tax=Lolium multiflorum TaxID=4521 RepID=A0AAD8T7J5_LOLMU|nr:hypothetical protein QYE76_059024 [Lolium multiflorum]
MLSYGMAADIFDEYLRMGESTCLESMYRFCRAVIAVFGEYYCREPNVEDTRRLLSINESRGFPGMIGSIDCMHWEWKNCPFGWQGMYSGHEEGRTVILEAIISQDLWIWHSFFGMAGSNNDINVLHRSPVFERLMQGKAPRVSYEINGNAYDKPYYLADGIYPDWATLVKTVRNPNSEKTRRFAKMQEACRKDVERGFGVLQARWAIVRHPARTWSLKTMHEVMTCCVIMHNMIVENERPDGRNENHWEFQETKRGTSITFPTIGRVARPVPDRRSAESLCHCEGPGPAAAPEPPAYRVARCSPVGFDRNTFGTPAGDIFDINRIAIYIRDGGRHSSHNPLTGVRWKGFSPEGALDGVDLFPASGEFDSCSHRGSISTILRDQFGMVPKRRTIGYSKPYPNEYELIPLPPKYRLPDFSKFNGSDGSSSIEHEKQLKLPEGLKIPTVQELNGKPYCKWHNSFSHTTNDCRVWRQQIQMAIEQGRLIFNQYAMKVDTHPFPAVNMVECTYPGGCQPGFSFNINMVGPGHHSGKDGDEGSCSHSKDTEEAVPRDRLRHDGKRYITEGEVRNVRYQRPLSDHLLNKYVSQYDQRRRANDDDERDRLARDARRHRRHDRDEERYERHAKERSREQDDEDRHWDCPFFRHCWDSE